MTRARNFATSIPAAGAVAIALTSCGGSGPTAAQLRETVSQYLTSNTPGQRCELFTTEYRTSNPDVLLSGGCERSEELTTEQEAARRDLHITHMDVHGAHATVTLAPGRTSPGAGPELTTIQLVVEHGKWRIDGLTTTASGKAVSGG